MVPVHRVDLIPKPIRVDPAKKSLLKRGTRIVSSNSKRPGRIEAPRKLKDGSDAYLVHWDDGQGMGVMTPDRLIVVETARGAPGVPDSTGAQPLYDKMAATGIRVDEPGLKETIRSAMLLETDLLADIREAIPGVKDFNPRSLKDWNELRSKQGKPPVDSYSEEALRAAGVEDWLLKAVVNYRSVAKRRQDLQQIEKRAEDGRIHVKWTEAATGRWYTGDPPIQTLSAAVREFLVPEEGNVFVTLDWNQHELRLLTEITKDPELAKIFENDADPHIAVYEKVTGQKVSAVPETRKRERDVGKMLNYALVYGLGASGLAHRLGIPEDRAVKLIEKHFAEFPDMARWIDSTQRKAQKDGFIQTLEGRKIPIDADPNWHGGRAGRQAVNYTAQGSSADHLVDLVRRIDEAGLLPHVKATIHDALLLDLPADQAEALTAKYRELMEAPFHGVTVPTDTKGPSVNWKDAMDGVNTGDEPEQDPTVGDEVKSVAMGNQAARASFEALRDAGGKVYVVGGAPRDSTRGVKPKDVDLLVSGLSPDQVHTALNIPDGRVDLTGKDFGVFRFKLGDEDVEIALPRTERSTGGGHQDFEVSVDPNLPLEDDLSRRDFSVNAMAVDLESGTLIDPFEGAKDLENKVLRAISPTSLAEDPLRVVRALVAAGRMGLEPDDATRDQMRDAAGTLPSLPQERIQAELDKLFAAPNPALGVDLARQTGSLEHILPEVARTVGFDQNNPHHEKMLYDHLLNVLERTASRSSDPDLRLAALLHDIGKPDSAWTDPETGSSHYYASVTGDGSVLGANHEDVGAKLAVSRLRDLKYPNDRIARIRDLVQHHMWPIFSTGKGARKFLAKVEPHADDLLTLRWADQGGKKEGEGPDEAGPDLGEVRALVDAVRKLGQATHRSDLAVTGSDLIAAGFTPGPELGAILRHLTEVVLEDPEKNIPSTLIMEARTFSG